MKTKMPEDNRAPTLARKGPIQVYIAKYSYDPFEHSPNENPDAELPLDSGDYVLVYGDMDEVSTHTTRPNTLRMKTPMRSCLSIPETMFLSTVIWMRWVLVWPCEHSPNENRDASCLWIPGTMFSSTVIWTRWVLVWPSEHSPNENRDAELPLDSRDYVLVYGDMDELNDLCKYSTHRLIRTLFKE